MTENNFPNITLNHRVLSLLCFPENGGLSLQDAKACMEKFTAGVDQVHLFSNGNLGERDEAELQSVLKCHSNASLIKVPEECSSSMPKIHNFVCKYEQKENSGKWGSWFLYIVKDCKFKSEMISFLVKLESMMKSLGVSAWMSTATDSCNYFFSKYNPRFKTDLSSAKEYSSLLPFKTVWCSHCNDSFMAYWMNEAKASDMLFNESFEIPMYYIISYIARLRADKSCPSFRFMNMYPTVEGETDYVEIPESHEASRKDFSKEEYEKEGKVFEDLKLDHSPDNSIDAVLDFMKDRLDASLEDSHKKENS